MSSRSQEVKHPHPKRELTTREKIILLESSKLHGFVFPPWKSAPEPAEFTLSSGTALYTDNEDLSLSDVQKENFAGWRRPSDLQQIGGCRDNALDRYHGSSDLVQDIITDCSVVASLCVVVERTHRGSVDILQSTVFPYNHALRQPAISENGKYIFQFHFNGCYRKVVIDDRLPSSRTSRALHVVDRNDPSNYWPALLEKAYLKVRGGYSFPGSNSGTDLWVLTGWIPEQLFLQSDEIDRHALWSRLVRGFGYGDVLITMGTGKLTESEEQGLGLVGEHDYAIIDVKEDDGQQLFLIKNPWSNGQIWNGHIQYLSPTPSINQNENVLESQENGISGLPRPRSLAPGTFWMPLNEVFQNFESIYLNWNPCLFSHREDIHFRWNLVNSHFNDGCLASHPQFSVRCKSAGVLWLLLSKHFNSSRNTNIIENDPGFISLYAFENNGRRAISSEGAIAHNQYVDSPNALLKLSVDSPKVLTIAVSEQDLPHKILPFSLSVLSFAPIELVPLGETHAHTSVIRGAWTANTSGGNAGSPLYHTNPQYRIGLDRPSDISLLLRTPHGWPVQVTMAWTKGQQVRSLITRDVVGDSGEYRKDFAFAELQNVAAGSYTIVCSTFKPNQFGDFELSVGSTTACRLDAVAAAHTGRFTTQVQDAIWTPGIARLRAPLKVGRLTRTLASAKSRVFPTTAEHPYASPLKISIQHGRGPPTRTIAVNGDDSFEDARHVSVHTSDVDILPEMCVWGLWVVLDRLGSSAFQHDERVEVQMFSDQPVEVGAWIPEN